MAGPLANGIGMAANARSNLSIWPRIAPVSASSMRTTVSLVSRSEISCCGVSGAAFER